LLVLDSICARTTKFLRIQSKLRSVSAARQSSVKVDVRYVSENFVLFLYINRNSEEEVLYTFFAEDIATWSMKGHQFVLALSERTLLKHKDKVFTIQTVERLRSLLAEQAIKQYTSIIIDGIFLENALRETMRIYSKIWPGIAFRRPSLNDIINQFLLYNRFRTEITSINCIIFLSGHHRLEGLIDIPDPRKTRDTIPDVKLSIFKSQSILTFEVLGQLERLINAENVILVADDISYEKSLNALVDKGVELILIKLKGDSGSRMYTPFRWADIAYPLGKALGLTEDQL
jgi:hypothetical protein